MKRKFHSPSQQTLPGFTIVEVMIALAASLLLMLGLTRAYKLIGDRITESQSNLEMGSTLRDIAFRLRDELRNTTRHSRRPENRVPVMDTLFITKDLFPMRRRC